MTKEEYLSRVLADYGISPDYPFDGDFDTAVLRHTDNRKWFAIIMRVSRKKFGFASGEMIDTVNLKLPQELFFSFGAEDGVYPAYHMNKTHWISLLLPDAAAETVDFLTNASYIVTAAKRKRKKTEETHD